MNPGNSSRGRSGASSRMIELRFPLGLERELVDSLARAGQPERVTHALVGAFETEGGIVITPFALRPVPDDMYLESEGFEARYSHRQLVKVFNEAAAIGAGVMIFHQHGRQHPSPSRTDRESFENAARAFRTLSQNLPVGSAVLGTAGGAHVQLRLGSLEVDAEARMRTFAPHIVHAPAKQAEYDVERFSRHDAVWGAEGQRKLAAATVAVVGGGGGGSHLVQQLAHVGIGRVFVVDDDRLENSNRSRVVGVAKGDVGALKAEVLAREGRRVSESLTAIPIVARFPEPKAIDALLGADLVIGAVDALQVRLEIQKLALRYVIPFIDIGLSIVSSGSGRRMGGHVAVAVPGGPCLRCMGLLSKAKLAAEDGGRGPAYVTGGGAAQVVSFNGVLASQAVSDALDLLTGFRGDDAPASRLVFNAMTRMLEPCETKKVDDCDLCGLELGRGAARW